MSDFSKSELAVFLKKNHLCPVCALKKLQNTNSVNVNGIDEYQNGTPLTPPMGWASWNLFRHKIDENLIAEMAGAMQKAGLRELGYTYVNIDDCWMSSVRDKNGRLQGDMGTFPSGMKALAEKINACGFQAGIYTSNGTLTCQDLPSSLGFEQTDADTFAEWGFEYFKYDFCHNVPIPTLAPEIYGLQISQNGTMIAEYFAGQAILQGNAQIFNDDSRPGTLFIGGLDAAMGKAIFNRVTVPENGEYALTLLVRRFADKPKYMEVCVNGTDVYEIRVPATKAKSGEARQQLTVSLLKGENVILLHNPVASRTDSAARQYRKMGLALIKAAQKTAEKNGTPVKPIRFSICEWGMHAPWKWGYTAGNLWRTTFDIKPQWSSVLAIYERNVRLSQYASPGHFNDPDMLEVGNGTLTEPENIAHFSLWCMMAAPLILGNDIRSFIKPDGTVDKNNRIYRIISNKNAISVNQDALGLQCRRIKTNLLTDVLVKPLTDNRLAVCLFNKNRKRTEIGFSLRECLKQPGVTLNDASSFTVTDVWDNTTFQAGDFIKEAVDAHGVKLYIIENRVQQMS